MPRSLDAISDEAVRLPKDQRYVLAQRILESIDTEGSDAVAAAWDSEIKERIRRYDVGLSKSIPGDQVFAELDRKLKR